MANLNDFTKKNPIFTGNTGIRIPVGTSADRDETANNAATFRYNQDIGGVEFYGPTGWVPLAAPPSISNVTPGTFNGESGTEFTINGSNFTSDAQVYFVTANSTDLLASTVTYIGPGQLRATTPRNILVQEEPLDVRVVQSSGSATRLDIIDAGGLPIWVTTAGTLGSVFGANVVNVYVTATDPEETAITYTISSGSLPDGLSLTSANGLIQGLANSVLANTTYNFTIKAADTVNNNTDRTFSYTIQNRAPVINTAAGSLGTFYSGNAVPSTTIDAYDPDGGQVQFQVSSGSLPDNTDLALSTGVISGTPIVVNANTTYTFEVTANDEGSLTASNTYSFTVLNRFPVWNTAAGSLADISDEQIDSYTPITVNAYDPDGEVVSYQLTSGSVPAGLTFVTANAAIAGVPESVESNTTSTFTVTVSDGSNETAREFTMTVRIPTDPFFANTVLLLHGDGSASSNGNLGFADSSNNNFAVTVNGDAYESNFSPFSVAEGQWSNYFDGSGDSLNLNGGSSLTLDGVDFTIESWVYLERGQNSLALCNFQPHATIGISLNRTGVGDTYVYIGNGSSWLGTPAINSNGVSNLSFETWHHVALVRNGSTLTLYHNGTVAGTTSTLPSGMNGNLYIGAVFTSIASEYFKGNISNFRVVKGTAVYTSTFTPSTSPLTAISGTSLLTCQSNRFKDNSTNNFAITRNGDVTVSPFTPFTVTPNTVDGSGYFDGTGDTLTLASNTAFEMGTGNFTIDFWFYAPSSTISGSSYILNTGSAGTDTLFISFGSSKLRLTNSSTVFSETPVLQSNTWYFIRFQRSSGYSFVYVNGVFVDDSFATNTTNYQQAGLVVGGNSFAGYISNLRVIKGSLSGNDAIISQIIGSPLNNIPNTQLLTCKYQGTTRNLGFIDNSKYNHRITRNGNTTQGTFSPFSRPDGSWSNYFDQSGDYFTFTGNSSTNFSGVDWCIESWVYLDKSPSTLMPVIFSQTGTNNWVPYIGFGINSSRNIYAAINATGNISTETVPLNSWNHIAMVRSGGIVKVYLNGVATSISVTSDINNSNLNFWIGYIGPPAGVTEQFGGYLSNLRVVKGSAVYTSNFTPSGPLTAITNTSLLTCQSNRFVDNSTNNFTLTSYGNVRVTPFSPFPITTAYDPAVNGGSGYFDGTGDYLKLPIFTVGSRPFTFECWFYCTGSFSSAQTLFGTDSSSSGTFSVRINSATVIAIDRFNVGSSSFTVPTLAPNTWNHLVAVRDSSNNETVFLNGVRSSSGSITDSYNYGVFSVIGRLEGTSTQYFNGYLCDTRFSIGSALYNPTQSTISVPTTPLTPVANTTFLCNFTNAGIFDNTGFNNLETVGNAQIDTSVKKYGTGAMKFDGSGDYLIIPSDRFDNFSFNTGDFTIEAWIYITAITLDRVIISSFTSWATSVNFYFAVRAGSPNILIFRGGNTVPIGLNGNSALSLNTWHHVAVSRASGTTRLFVDGVTQTNTHTGSVNVSSTTQRTVIGAGSATFDENFSGLIDELRITKGVARYTTNFTPRSRAFPNR